MRRPVALLALLAASCMRAGAPPSLVGSAAPPAADSVTVGLWRMDERAGTRAVDSGPFHLDATTGRATLVHFGRFGLARDFQRALDSFLYVPFDPALHLPHALTVEAWVYARAFGSDEDTPLAARWTEEANRQSWIFSLGGERLLPPVILDPSPGYHLALFPRPAPGHVWFAYQPETAGPPRAFVSARPIERERWTHVAVTFDGEEVRFFIDGELDSQYATAGRIRTSEAPLLAGNYFDPRSLNRFGGDLSPESPPGAAPHYAFQGLLDELRISSVARSEFPAIEPR